MSVQILRTKVDLPAEDMEYFDLTLEAISRLGHDVDELLDFTKPPILKIDTIPLHEIVEDARDAVQGGVSSDVCIEHHVPIELEVPVDEAPPSEGAGQPDSKRGRSHRTQRARIRASEVGRGTSTDSRP